jgi:hypothetical protein
LVKKNKKKQDILFKLAYVSSNKFSALAKKQTHLVFFKNLFGLENKLHEAASFFA